MKVTYARQPLTTGSLFAGDAWLTWARCWCYDHGLTLASWSMARTFTDSDGHRHEVRWDAEGETWEIV